MAFHLEAIHQQVCTFGVFNGCFIFACSNKTNEEIVAFQLEAMHQPVPRMHGFRHSSVDGQRLVPHGSLCVAKDGVHDDMVVWRSTFLAAWCGASMQANRSFFPAPLPAAAAGVRRHGASRGIQTRLHPATGACWVWPWAVRQQLDACCVSGDCRHPRTAASFRGARQVDRGARPRVVRPLPAQQALHVAAQLTPASLRVPVGGTSHFVWLMGGPEAPLFSLC